MLSRLLFVRLRTAENAVRDGRLDEAHRLAMAPDIREHRRGAAVLATLTERFVERARHHFRADRFTEALLDLDRAETGGVMKEQITELREHVRTVSNEQQRQERSRRDRVNAARRRVEGGSLAAGRRILEQASKNDQHAADLRDAVECRTEDVAQLVAEAKQLLSQGQTAAAAQRVLKAKKTDAHHEGVIRIEKQLCDNVLERARQALVDGKPRLASDELACLGHLGKSLPALNEIRQMLSLADDTARCVRNHEYVEARRHALSLVRLLPKARWIDEIAKQLQQMGDLATAFMSGPLGESFGTVPSMQTPSAPRNPQMARRSSSLDDTLPLPGASGGGLPSRLLLLVDGGGSYLLLRGERTTLGRAASNKPADVPMFSDVAECHANITRVDDDYFLFSEKNVEVGGKSTRHQLLRNGDRIMLGRKAKMTFRLPTRKSSSAVLDMSDTTKMPNDVRRVILFDKHVSVGSGPSAHIRCEHAGPSLVLFERSGSLWIRQKDNGHVQTDAAQLEIGKPIEIAGASLVLQPWEMRRPGARRV